jgi:hypothetical protein
MVTLGLDFRLSVFIQAGGVLAGGLQAGGASNLARDLQRAAPPTCARCTSAADTPGAELQHLRAFPGLTGGWCGRPDEDLFGVSLNACT